MNPIIKKILFVITFVLVTLVLPCVVLLLFVDASKSFAFYVVTYGVIIFAILGYIISSVRSMEKKLEETMEEIKMQNAAIAYKITNSNNEISASTPEHPISQAVKEEAAPVDDTTNIPLNPAEPLIMPTEKKTDKVADDGFDDFK